MRKLTLALLLVLVGVLPSQAEFTFEFVTTHPVAIGDQWDLIELEAWLTNTGDERDSYDIHKEDFLPGGEFDWSASICVGETCFAPFVNDVLTDSLDPGESILIRVDILIGIEIGTGMGRLTINSHSSPGAVAIVHEFTGIHSDCDFLLLDGGTLAENLGGTIAGGSGAIPGVWPLRDAHPEVDDLLIFDKAFWLSGAAVESADEIDMSVGGLIDSYFDAGGSLCLSGQDLAEAYLDPAGAFYAPENAAIWADVIGLDYLGNGSSLDLAGRTGDHIGDGLAFALDGSQSDPDRVTFIGADDPFSISFRYDSGAEAGETAAFTVTTPNDGRLVYLGFGLEGTGAEMGTIVDRICEVLSPVTGIDEGQVPAQLVRLGNVPNPFNPKTMIRFRAPASGSAEVSIHDVSGRRVQLLRVNATAGENAVTWNGTDAAGRNLPSGTYFYRISQGAEQVAGKMTLLK